jgi:hypothetical protein
MTRINAAMRVGALLAVVTGAGVAGVLRAQAPARGGPVAPRPDNPQSLMHIEAARALAGGDPWLQAPFGFYCVAGTREATADAPELEPVKLFDNVCASATLKRRSTRS